MLRFVFNTHCLLCAEAVEVDISDSSPSRVSSVLFFFTIITVDHTSV